MTVDSVTVAEAGSGVEVAGDLIESSTKIVQYVKLMDGTDGSAVPAVVDAAGNVMVNIAGYGASVRCTEITLTSGEGAVSLHSKLAGGIGLGGRKSLMIIVTGDHDCSIGSSTVQKWPLAVGVTFSQDWGAGVNPYILTAGDTTTLVVLETA